MLLAFELIAEERIREAIDRGEFDNLPGKGKPLTFEDDSHIPEELRLAHKMLKNSGCLPPEMERRKEIQEARDLLESLDDEQQRYRQMQKLNALVAQANMRRSRPVHMEEQEAYYAKAVEKISVRGKGNGS